MGLAPMEGVSPGSNSEMAMLLPFSHTGTLSMLLFRWSTGCSLDPLDFSIANFWLCDTVLSARSLEDGISLGVTIHMLFSN